MLFRFGRVAITDERCCNGNDGVLRRLPKVGEAPQDLLELVE
jgi:hypothetical protein